MNLIDYSDQIINSTSILSVLDKRIAPTGNWCITEREDEEPLYNGFRRLFTSGLQNEPDQDIVNAHLAMILNTLFYESHGHISHEDMIRPSRSRNSFNGIKWWMEKYGSSKGRTINEDKITLENLLSSKDLKGLEELYIFCSLETKLSLMSKIRKPYSYLNENCIGYNNHTKIYIYVVDHFSTIGKEKDIFILESGAFNFYIGEDNFLTPDNITLGHQGMLPGEARFCQLIEDYSVRNNIRVDMMISYFSILPNLDLYMDFIQVVPKRESKLSLIIKRIKKFFTKA